MKLLNNPRALYNKLMILVLTWGPASSALASAGGPKDIGGLFGQGGDAAGSILDGLLQMLALGGFVWFVINGVKLLMDNRNNQESSATNWKGLLIGIFLMAPFTFQALFFNSTLNDSKSASDIRKVIEGK